MKKLQCTAFGESKQYTLAAPISLTGIGLHSGLPVDMQMAPAAVNSGITFIRKDISPAAVIPARADLVTETRLGSVLTNAQGVSVSTVEHLMAALWGMGIDNATLYLNAGEVPIMDGSSLPFIEAIHQAGLQRQAAPRRFIKILKPLEIRMGESLLRIEPADSFTLDIEIDYDHARIARQCAFYDFDEDSFEGALAEARTFGFLSEVEQLQKIGLARGGSLENAIVLSEDDILNHEGLRSQDEFVRHKALDCVGDLYLAGHRILGAVTAVKPGHHINTAMARLILEREDAREWVAAQPALATPVSTKVEHAAYV
jgi:UDP-3-O-[3-hydroxymyristoyl] N-acetylglucosamine deacetylase